MTIINIYKRLRIIQFFINYFYRFPRSKWQNIERFGGLREYIILRKNKAQMIDKSFFLPEIRSYKEGLKIYILTGQQYLYQTLFCAYSLCKTTDEKIQFILVDDGSFNKKLINRINKQMPDVKMILKDEISQNLNNVIPRKQYPYLHHKRKVYPHIKKITDIHTIGDDDFKLVLDSDMLFWNNPIEMIKWLKNPHGCLHMLDTVESYGFDKQLMKFLCGSEIPELLNVGVFGMQSNTINWGDLENWSKNLEENSGPSYFLEQALSTMLAANRNRTILTKKDYVVNPDEDSPYFTDVKLHHYVDLSKKYYFNAAWKKFI